MPPINNKVDRKAWILNLFPVDVFEDYQSPRDKFDKMKPVDYYTVSASFYGIRGVSDTHKLTFVSGRFGDLTSYRAKIP